MAIVNLRQVYRPRHVDRSMSIPYLGTLMCEEEDFEEIDDFESEEFEEDTIYCQYCQQGFTDFDEWKAHEEEEAAKGET